jgi:site-specific DNA recombinase
MSNQYLDPPFVAKDGHTLRLLGPVRVSDPDKQDERSLGDQRVKIDAWTKDHTELPFEFTVLEGRGSGECLDREDFLRLVELVDTGNYDGVVCEDLGRILRRIEAVSFCEHCVDLNTRLIAINDHIDTAKDGWEDASIFAAWHHQRSNRDTSQRIKRSHRNRFVQGGCVREPAYGWIKLPGAKSDADLQKDPAAEAIYVEWFRLLDEEQATFEDIARFLRSRKVQLPTRTPGVFRQPYGKSVARHTFNVMLKGERERNRRKTKRINNPGKYVSVDAPPEDLLQRKVPHLAFFTADFYDRVVAKVRARNAKFRRSQDPKADPCTGRSRKQSRAPGPVVFDAICNRRFVWGGHGQTDRMMCDGAREHRCWNGATFDGPLAARRIADAALDEVEKLEDFSPFFLQTLNEEGRQLDEDRQRRLHERQARMAVVEAEIANVMAYIRRGKASDNVDQELAKLEQQQAELRGELAFLAQQPPNSVEIPSTAEIRRLVHESFTALATDDPEFARAFRKLVPRIVVFPVRLCDGGQIVLRAKFRLYLANLVPDRRAAEMLRRPLTRVLTVDLFDQPQREMFRRKIVAARTAGKTEAEAARAMGITKTAAQKAAALQRKMDELGINDPYVPVTEPLEDCPKRRRHRHPDYRFDPLPGAGEI